MGDVALSLGMHVGIARDAAAQWSANSAGQLGVQYTLVATDPLALQLLSELEVGSVGLDTPTASHRRYQELVQVTLRLRVGGTFVVEGGAALGPAQYDRAELAWGLLTQVQGGIGAAIPVGGELVLTPYLAVRGTWEVVDQADAATTYLFGLRFSGPVRADAASTHPVESAPLPEEEIPAAAMPSSEPPVAAPPLALVVPPPVAARPDDDMQLATTRVHLQDQWQAYVTYYLMTGWRSFHRPYLDRLPNDPIMPVLWRASPRRLIAGIDDFVQQAQLGGTLTDNVAEQDNNAIRLFRDLLHLTLEHATAAGGLPAAALATLLQRYRDPRGHPYPGTAMGANLYLVFLDRTESRYLPSAAALEHLRRFGCMNHHVDRILQMRGASGGTP